MALQMSKRLLMSWRSIRRWASTCWFKWWLNLSLQTRVMCNQFNPISISRLVWRRRSTSMRRNFIQRWWKRLLRWRVCPLPSSPYSLKESTRGKAEDQLLVSYQLEDLPHLFSSWSGLKYHTSVWSEPVLQKIAYLIFSELPSLYELLLLHCCSAYYDLLVEAPYLTNLWQTSDPMQSKQWCQNIFATFESLHPTF